MTELERQEKAEKFKGLLLWTGRDGIDKLLEFIGKSDFYTAPASTKFHGSYEGGLLEHSLNVYNRLHEKMSKDPIWIQVAEKKGYTEENYIISALLHDICKTYYYTQDFKNQKTYDVEKVKAANPKEVKKDNHGAFIWESVPFYTVEDKIPLGHGVKSVFMIEEYIKLKPCERYSVRWHMGAYDVTHTEAYTLGNAMELHPLVLALHEADMEATHIMEV